MDLGTTLVLGLVFGAICAVLADQRGRSAVAWFFLGFLLGCIGLIILLVIPDLKVEEERQVRDRKKMRRMREQQRKDRMISDHRHGEVERRLGAHDQGLGVDTRGNPPAISPGKGGPPPIPARSSRWIVTDWHYVFEEDRIGPIAFDDLKALWDQHEVDRTTLVWTDVMDDWLPIGEVDDLLEELDA